MSSTYSLEDVPEQLRAQYAALPPAIQQRMFASLGRLREGHGLELEQQKIDVPEPPAVDEREFVRAQLNRGFILDGDTLSDEAQWEIDAQLGLQYGDRTLRPSAHNQPVRMLTLFEAAQLIGVSTSTVWRLTRARGLPSLRFFKTVRVRSDHAWAVRNKLAAGVPLGNGRDLMRHYTGAADRGVPIDEVAATLRVHPQTLWRWWRRFAEVSGPGRSNPSLPWRCAGRRAAALIPEDVLAVWEVPYAESSLRHIRLTDVIRLSPAEKKLAAVAARRIAPALTPEQIRRADTVSDAVSGERLYTSTEAARLLNMTPSGALKALSRAGIATSVLGGVTRVRHDDLFQLINQRSAKVNRRVRPWFTPDHGKDPAMVPIADAATRIGVTVRTLRRRAAVGKIVLVTSEGKLFMRRHEVHAAGTSAVGDERAAERGERDQFRPNRGAALTAAHIDTFTAWMAWRHPDVALSTALLSRARAAAFAGCRPRVIEELVTSGLIPARRDGRDLQIRLVDLVAAGAFSSQVARMCPKLRPVDTAARRNVESEYLSFDHAARYLKRTTSEVRYLVQVGTLHAVRFGNGAHRLHESEINGPALRRFNDEARPYRELKRVKHMGWGLTVNDAANHLGVSERTVLRLVAKGALLAEPASKDKWCRTSTGALVKLPIRVNHGGLLLSERSVRTALRLRQVRGLMPREAVLVTPEHLGEGTAPPLQPWQRYLLVDVDGNPLDEYGKLISA